jgi:hypothetical protein
LVQRATSLLPPQSTHTEDALDDYLSTLSVLQVLRNACEMVPEEYDNGI